jgi:hypothetical protein
LGIEAAGSRFMRWRQIDASGSELIIVFIYIIPTCLWAFHGANVPVERHDEIPQTSNRLPQLNGLGKGLLLQEKIFLLIIDVNQMNYE